MRLTDGSRAIERKDAIVDNTLVKVIARGHRWHRMLCDGVYNTIEDLAAIEKINASYVSRVARLALLAPEIVEEILALLGRPCKLFDPGGIHFPPF